MLVYGESHLHICIGHALGGDREKEIMSDEPRWLGSGGVAEISLRLVLEAAAALDSSGGASLALIAWELCVEEREVAEA